MRHALSGTTRASLTRSSSPPPPSPAAAKRVMQPRARATLRVYNGDARVNATNKFPTSADERNPREFNAARHCRIMSRAPADAVAYPTRVFHSTTRVYAPAREFANACVPTRARTHTRARSHTHARRESATPTIARARRQFTSYTRAVIARINNLITYMRPR